MLLPVCQHEHFQSFLQCHLPALITRKALPPKKFARFITAVWLLDCDAAIPVLSNLYSPTGRPAHDPVALIRSLSLMHLAKFHSITAWVDELRGSDAYAILSGFLPDKTPGVGTFYDFINRLWADKFDYSNHLRVYSAKPRKSKKDESGKLPMRRPGIVDRLVNKSLSNRVFTHSPERFLQNIFADVVVSGSLLNGTVNSALSNGIRKLCAPLSGDGTAIRTATNPYGVKVCDCRERRIFNCDCPRHFTDYHANWGWDSYEKQFFYGRHFYFIVSPDNDLPLFFSSAQASRHDAVHGVVAFSQFRHFNPNISFDRVCLDSAHDTLSFYNLLDHWNVEPFIDLKRKPAAASGVNAAGQPLCKANLPLIDDGWCSNRNRRKWRCPKFAGSKISIANAYAICKDNCSSSNYGRTLYTFPASNLRLYPKTPRGSQLWKTTYNSRTCAERLNKKITIDYLIERCRVQSSKHWVFRQFLLSICLHLDVWCRNITTSCSNLLDLFQF